MLKEKIMYSPIKEFRQKMKFSQDRLAITAKVKQSHISEVEQGYKQINDNLFAFLKLMGCDIQEIRKKQEEYMLFIQKQSIELAKQSIMQNNNKL